MSEKSPGRAEGHRLLPLALGALGVVFGDIGTSPLYALRECFSHHGLVVNEYNVLVPYPRFAFLRDAVESTERLWVGVLDAGMRAGDIRADVPADAVYRFLRDAIWVSVRWYNPAGDATADEIADSYVAILLDGIASAKTGADR